MQKDGVDPRYEETDLFSYGPEEKKRRTRKTAAAKKVVTPAADKAPAEKAEKISKAPALWAEKWFTFDITHPMAEMKDTMKAALVADGFTKREANHIFKGLFFKEKVCNTKRQAEEYLRTVPSSYAVKFKIGIPPSPKMMSLEKRLKEKEERLASYTKEQNEKKFSADFLTCPHCHSRVNMSFVKPPLCPVCGGDLRSDTAVKTIASLTAAVADLRKRYEDTARKYNSKFTGGEKWMVRLVNSYKE